MSKDPIARKEYQRQYWAKNRERLLLRSRSAARKASARKYRQEHKEQINARVRAYYARNPERLAEVRAQRNRWHKEHPEQIKEGALRYRQTEKGKAKAKRWNQSEKGKAARKRYEQKLRSRRRRGRLLSRSQIYTFLAKREEQIQNENEIKN